ncbi:lysophospholipid transporter LplT [Methylomonas paludis]|uniref:Lysophospholipid transporter LplT n=1 Tax=Methylomonas paludis TaxID=1173101 RepID=A0A975R8F7_9GAMM|nr:lysophospholipid transporter LplT [Methylomonas paludis]QWF69932.1 lysophospholipid transporter LplT [Methylomonas paludis]
MNKALLILLLAQFLSVFADNTILFTVIAMVMHSPQTPGWYVPALQSVFLISFVGLAPWVGIYADRHPKARVLILANLIKACGAGLVLLQIDALAAYAVVGIGAAIYSPAKYGILPELAGHQELVKANSWIEGSTILAILTGMVAGARLADYSVNWSMLSAILLLLISAAAALLLPKGSSKPVPDGWKIRLFYREIRYFIAQPRTRFAVLGGSMFWAGAASVRVIIIAWAPLVLLTRTATDIAELTLFLALGIILGSALVPKIIPLEHLRRARIPAYLMGAMIIGLSFTDTVWAARGVLLLMGTAGGMFIVPINAALQEQGQLSIGSGGAVAMQNFFQNAAMLLSVGIYSLAAAQQLSPIAALQFLGILIITATILLMLTMPQTTTSAANLE